MSGFEAGVYDLTAAEYHADPVPAHLGGSLSVSGAKRLLPPSTPAHFRHYIEHGQEPRDYFDIGTAAHAALVGPLNEIAVIEFPDWRSRAAQAERAEARLNGHTPILAADWQVAEDMAGIVLADPIAGPLFLEGHPEQSMFWQDNDTNVWRRGRADWITGNTIVDYKTAASANPREFERSAARLGYDMQDAWYCDAAEATGVVTDVPRFLFVVQEKTPPYLVTVVELDDDFRKIGRSRNRRAIDAFVECMNAERWPGYAEGIVTAAPPRWHALESEEF